MVNHILLENIIESSYDGIFITDKNGLVLFVNRAYEKLAERDRHEYVGKYMTDLMKSGIMNTYISKEVALKKETITATEYLISGKNVIITGNPVFDEFNEVVAVVTNVRDVSQIMKLEREAAISKELVNIYQKEIYGRLADDIVCVSEATKRVMSIAKRVAQKDSTVLITGETGVGKEVVAKFIHGESLRNKNSYIKINCGAIPKNLLESELFGYVRGAFSGASIKGKIGIFELANEGTLFLDEIGELPMDMQTSLLRVLQEGEITRIGDEKSRKIDVRIIAATNRNLEQMVVEGKFRRDLFYRLDVISIYVPPLEERKDDIPALAEYFVNKLNMKYGEKKTIGDNFIKQLINRKWLGNIRELSNYIERQYILQDADDLNSVFYAVIEGAISEQNKGGGTWGKLCDDELPPLEEAINEVEKQLVLKAMEMGKTTVSAAKLLGISQSSLSRKYRKHIGEMAE